MNEYKKSRHCVYMIRYHIILITKYRHKVITNEIKNEIYKYLKDAALKLDTRIIEINGEEDHVHFILETKPTTSSISVIINVLKSVSSRLIRKKHNNILKIYYGNTSKFWSRSYFVASVGEVSLDTLKKYIENQDKTNSSPTCRG